MTRITRRLFLAATGAAAVASPARAARRTPNPRLLRHDVADLVLPGDPRLDALSRPQNLAYTGTRPLAVARCAEPHQVARAILWARENDVPFALRSGGHSYAGCSVTDGLLIDMKPLSRIEPAADGTVRLGGGVLNGQIYDALRSRDLAITHGRCAGVGASAFLMGGGIGFAMRDRGLGCDLVRAADLVLADGTQTTASPTHDADLFWAVRGAGGGNLGAATAWTLATVPAEPVTFIDLTWREPTPALLIALVHALERSPDRMGTKVALIAPHGNHGLELKLLGQLRGPKQEAQDLLASALSLGKPSGRLEFMPYWPAQDLLSEAGLPAHYRETSRMIGPMPEALAENAFRRIATWPGTSGEGLFKMFHVGGRVRATAPGDTAYVHRQAEWISGTEVTWTAADRPARIEAALAWQRAFHWSNDQLAQSPGGSYQNFPDPGLEHPAESYYGANLPRLAAIRRRVDPQGAFTPPRRQGIAGSIVS